MMKRTIPTLLLCGALALSFAGCNNNSSSSENHNSNTSSISDVTPEAYKDGNYRAEAEEFSHGWKEYVILTIHNGKLTDVEFDADNEDASAKKSADADYKKSMMEGNNSKGLPETYPEQYQKELKDSLMAKNGEILKVESVAGATSSSNAFRDLVKAALSKATTGDTTTAVVANIEEE